MEDAKLEEINKLLDKVQEACKGSAVTEEEIMMIINNGNPGISRQEIMKKLIAEKRSFLDRAEEYLDQIEAAVSAGTERPAADPGTEDR